MTFIDQNDTIELEKLLIQNLDKEKGQEIMGNIAEQWKEEGIEIGIQDGIKIGEAMGEARGKVKGRVEGKAELIKMMIANGQSIDNIAKITGLSVADIRKL